MEVRVVARAVPVGHAPAQLGELVLRELLDRDLLAALFVLLLGVHLSTRPAPAGGPRTAAAAPGEAKRKSEADKRAKAEMDARARAEADACQDLLRSASSKGVITFKRASAEIDRESYPTLDALVRIVAKCPQALIQVEGHTDSDGTIERNQLLSERRAAAVAEYLIRAGVAQTRLTAVGIGQMRPIASNETFEGKSRNRRIEFVVRQ